MPNSASINKRKKYRYDWKWIFLPCALLVGAWYLICLYFVRFDNPIWALIFIATSLYLLYRILRKMYVAFFVRLWKDRDINALENEIIRVGLGNYAVIKEILQTKRRSTQEYEFLRASGEPQDNTLLRAAAHTDNTPQEQLLRPANNDETAL